MLGTNYDSVGWPTCGEIDIMENIGKTSDQGTDHGTIHGPQNGDDYNDGAGVTGTYTLPGGAALADDFHIYAVEWTTNQIKWFLDTNHFFTATPASLPGGSTWVFTAAAIPACSTSPSAAVGPATRMGQQSFPNKCWWITCGFTSKRRRWRFQWRRSRMEV